MVMTGSGSCAGAPPATMAPCVADTGAVATPPCCVRMSTKSARNSSRHAASSSTSIAGGKPNSTSKHGGRRPQFRFPFCNFPLQFLYE